MFAFAGSRGTKKKAPFGLNYFCEPGMLLSLQNIRGRCDLCHGGKQYSRRTEEWRGIESKAGAVTDKDA